MFIHSALFWLRPDLTAAERQTFDTEIRHLARLPYLARGYVGTQAPTEARPVTDKTFDYATALHFKSLADHEHYQTRCEVHARFIATCHTFWQRVVVQDMAPLETSPSAREADLLGTPAFMPGRQRCELTVADRHGRNRRVVYTSDVHLEAPNWTPDGLWLVYNSQGALFRVRADGSGAPERIDTGTHAEANNDHVLSPDGRTVYLSTNDGRLLATPLEGSPAGGTPRRVSNEDRIADGWHYYLHGVSPDDRTLAYVGLRMQGGVPEYGLYLIPTAGGPDQALLQPGVPVDGPEYSPDGAWVYFNGEIGARTPGHSQLFRIRPDGTGLEQLTHDERVNWFPHLSPDGRWMLYLSYPPGTLGHPANRRVLLRIAPADGGAATDLVELLGGQGTVNVHSWAPDSEHFAYVAYPAV
jgi:TolB protein